MLHTLRRKFLIIVLPSILMGTLVFSLVLGILMHQEKEKELKDSIHKFAQIQSNILADSTWDLDISEIKAHVKSILTHPHVQGVKIDIFQTEYEFSKGVEVSDISRENYLIINKPIKYTHLTTNEKLGELILVSNKDIISREMSETFSRVFFLLLVLLFAITISAVIAHRVTILNPLNRFLRSIHSGKESGRPDVVQWDSNDELGSVIKSYNSLVQKLNNTEQRLQTLADNLPGVLFQIRYREKGDSEVTYVSAEVKNMIGISPSDLLHKSPPVHMLSEQEKNKILQAFQDALARMEPLEQELAIQASSGEEKWLRLMARPRKVDGDKIMFEGMLFDVTQRKREQKERLRLEEQLRQSQKMEAIGRLTGGIAHDFNNMLQIISGNIQLILESLSSGSKEHKKVQEIEQAAERAENMVKHLLTFSREMEIEPRRTDINNLIQDAVYFLQRTLPKNIDINLNLLSEKNELCVDPNQIEQIIINLVSNARDAMPNGGRIIIATTSKVVAGNSENEPSIEPGEYIVLSISDTGIGMSPETREQIFEPFFSTKSMKEGTGLGLSIVYGIIKKHGGDVVCRSEVGVGTEFDIYLPQRQSTEVEPREVPGGSREVQGGNEKILVVDDEESILEMTGDMLENYGYTVYLARDGEKALDMYRSHTQPPDLVVLDLGMPGMGGKECLQEIRKIDPEVKAIIVSGYMDHSFLEEIDKEKNIAFVKKPYKFKKLLTRIRDLLDN